MISKLPQFGGQHPQIREHLEKPGLEWQGPDSILHLNSDNLLNPGRSNFLSPSGPSSQARPGLSLQT
jgi:hypothetical protein